MIDWSKPLYSYGRRMHIIDDRQYDSENDRGFLSTVFEGDPVPVRWYYNTDGTPFAKNPHPISNSPHHPNQLAIPLPDPTIEAMERLPNYATF